MSWFNRLRHWIWGHFVSGWATFLLVAMLVTTFGYSVDAASWVKDDRPVIAALTWGLLLGALLANTRWKGWIAALYSLLMSLVIIANAVGSVLPGLSSLFSTPFLATLDAGHLRLFTLQLRVTGWVDTLRAGGTIRDTGLFVFLLALIGWSSAAWLAWWILRRREGLPGLLPMTLLMAINVHLSQQARMTLIWYFFFFLLIVARTAFIARQRSWIERRIDFPDELGADWGTSAVLIGVAVGVVALAASVFGTREGWQAISDLVQRSRVRMSNTAEQLFGGVKPPPPAPDAGSAKVIPSVNTPDLGEIGSPLPSGDETVLWAWVSDPPPPPIEVQGPGQIVFEGRRHYWRSQVYAAYTGRGWKPAPLAEGRAPVTSTDQPPPGRYELRQRYEIDATHKGVLFAVSQPVKVSSGPLLRQTSPDGSTLLEGSQDRYEVTSLATDASIFQMDQAGYDYPAGIRQAYLQLPPSLPGRVKQLAQEVAGNGSAYQKAKRIQDYLRANYKYDLNAKPAPANRDVVDYFLFDSQTGFCSHFATAMAVMLRADGVPARVAVGYAMGIFDPRKGMYRVPESASHAWVEVFFPTYGWVEFEPTPAYSTFTYDPGTTNGVGQSNGPVPTKPEKTSGSGLLWLLVPVLVIAGLWGAYVYGRIDRARRKEPGLLALSLYPRVRRWLAWGGLPSTASLTPGEYLAESRDVLSGFPQLGDALQRATNVYVLAAYSPRQPEYREVEMSEWSWSQARWEWLRLWIGRLVRRTK